MLVAREYERIRWRCRRGMLELDLILSRFAERHLARLDARQLASFQALLTYPDNDLFELVTGRRACDHPQLNGVIELIKAA